MLKQPKADWVEEKEPIINYNVKKKKKSLKELWENQYGEGTSFDLDYGKLVILFLCVYIAIQVS